MSIHRRREFYQGSASQLDTGIMRICVTEIPIMQKRRFMQVDVFSNRAGYGNPLAVVIDAEGLDTQTMQRFAAWTNLSETSFLLPPTTSDADYRVRIFTPRQELPFAGHPSVGAAWVATEAGIVHPVEGRLVQECAAGLLVVVVSQKSGRTRTRVQTPAPSIRELNADLQPQLLAIFPQRAGFDPSASRLVNNGPEWLLVERPDEDSVRTYEPELALISKLCLDAEAVGVAVFALSESAEYQMVVRAFCPADGIPEDPVTGSANAAIAALLHSQGRLATIGSTYRASQGREVDRDGIIDVGIDASGRIWIGGDTVAAIEGALSWP